MTIAANHRPITANDGCQDQVLLDQWYAVGFVSDFPPGAIHRVTLLERDLIVWRSSDGSAHAWEDLCVHRGARLSKGWLDNDTVICPYHGWRYDRDGACVLMPAAPDEKPMRKARAFPYPVEERYGFVWVCLGDPAAGVPEFPQWDDESFMKVHSGPYHFDGGGFRAVENFVDASHFPFVHAGFNGVRDAPDELEPYTVQELPDGSLKSSEVRVFQPIGDARGKPVLAFYTYTVFAPLVSYFSKRTVDADAEGNAIAETSNTFTTLFAVQPLDATHCVAYVCAALNALPRPEPDAVRARADVIFNQDREIVATQRPERIPVELRHELHHRTDLMGQRYRSWLRGKGITYGVI
ncbi:aromatic ring-hydroxylating dioxygenase subunit alpha [Nocardia sp. BMG51109]|uniref:aromatic ring-hydroxylating oxygenase subunit alpha n=1 Tax=Nocardia sp. BMG51109 TaxID=1056816 RepID=UPI000467208B|nr:aromatic ring-hydroxylating dioxygenase subunit alpha [Nocardia sp. BMG51109]